MKKIVLAVVSALLISVLSACGNTIINSTDETYITVPNVVGLTIDEAETLLMQAGAKNVVSNVDEFEGTSREKIFVSSQSVKADESIPESKEVELKCNKFCSIYLDLTSEDNLLFNKYDIELFLDEDSIGTVPNGKVITCSKDVLDGKHSLKAVKSGNDSVYATKTFSITDDITVSCTIKHGGSIEFIDFVTESGAKGASLEMPNVVGSVLSSARDLLSSTGFVNLHYEPFSDIWNENNWVVVEQTVQAGEIIDKNQAITLNCIKLNSYYEDLFDGKDASQILLISKEKNISVKFIESGSYKDITSNLLNANDADLKKWVYSDSSQDTSSFNTAKIYVRDNTKTTASSSETATSTQNNSTVSDDYVYYSSNTYDIAKQGNKGKFAYIDRGTLYDNYIIVDFDAGTVYFFAEGDDNTWCDKTKIDSGDLNSQLFTTYHDGVNVWTYCLHFKYKNNPTHLVLEDNFGYTYDYAPVDLDQATKYRDGKNISEY